MESSNPTREALTQDRTRRPFLSLPPRKPFRIGNDVGSNRGIQQHARQEHVWYAADHSARSLHNQWVREEGRSR